MHKEMRLLIPALPFLYILTSYGIIYFSNLFKKNKSVILWLLLVIFLVSSIPNLEFNRYEDNLDIFYDYVSTVKIENGLWISNPAFIAFSDLKADELVYFPIYGSERIDELTNNLDNAKHILLNTCDIPCPPWDNTCTKKNIEFFDLLKEEFILNSNINFGQCEYFIFKSNKK